MHPTHKQTSPIYLLLLPIRLGRDEKQFVTRRRAHAGERRERERPEDAESQIEELNQKKDIG